MLLKIAKVYNTFAENQNQCFPMSKPKILLAFLPLLLFVFCKNQDTSSLENPLPKNTERQVEHATGFDIDEYYDYTLITIKTPWPESDREFKYALVSEGVTLENAKDFDVVITVPIKRIAVTSTTHIPALELLGETDALVGFPNLDFISSEKTRQRIAEGKVTDLGKNEDLNTEILIDLSPDVLVGFGMDGTNPSFPVLQKVGIPVLYNADWTETTPLGKSEWIKFFGALFDKQELADSIFNSIKTEYLAAKEIASHAKNKPTVIVGAMFKDIWYVAQGDSWGSQFIADAHGDYLWKDSKGTGSLPLNLESVLDKGHDADVWIGPGQFTTLEGLKSASASYTQFKAFKTGEVYTYSLKKGEKGGTIYFEMAPIRPDFVLKDLIKILHPELLPDHELYFFDKLQ